MKNAENFRVQVCNLVKQIPEGRVMTYGQIAALCGRPLAARIVGGIAHIGDIELPWQRVVKKDGSLAEGYPGGITSHAVALEVEGIQVAGNKVDIERLQWWPPRK